MLRKYFPISTRFGKIFSILIQTENNRALLYKFCSTKAYIENNLPTLTSFPHHTHVPLSVALVFTYMQSVDQMKRSIQQNAVPYTANVCLHLTRQ